MNEDDSARREFVLGLFLITIATPLIAGLAAFAAILGAFFISEGLERVLAARRRKPAPPGRLSPPPSATQRALRHTGHRHARRALSTRRPGGVLH
ncbi:hypothetical protein [Nocardia aurantiaca]|uniref:Uncharacterized protein n=1 Tax=Nocardia aurantiaca TaxID=2675850 RepID=A0A6I3KYA1_9NOCA|nr:hypothetical protein [Nocardia aurantiaca]MTE13526.1 hypothetical protein [Nocardia aurantiaca]